MTHKQIIIDPKPLPTRTRIEPDAILERHAIAELEAQRAELLAALKAIKARIDGDYDNPALVAFGPLHTDISLDCALLADAAIAKAEGR